jgi:hypothetical protein
MTEAEWRACTDPREMLDFPWDRVSDRKARLFAVACCRCSRQLLLNKDLCKALEVGSRYADGRATDEELTAAYQLANGLALGPLYHWDTERQIHRWAEAVAVAYATRVVTPDYPSIVSMAADAAWHIHRSAQRNPNPRLSDLVRDIFGNPFRAAALDHAWLASHDGTVPNLAKAIYDDRAFDRLPILADALEDAGCADAAILDHCRSGGEHVRGCWVIDLLLGKK